MPAAAASMSYSWVEKDTKEALSGSGHRVG